MRIGIDARLYKAGLGIGRYIEQLLLHLGKLENTDEYVIFLRKEMMNAYVPPNPRFKKVCLDVPWYSFSEQFIVPFVFFMHKVDLMHIPHFNAPLLYPKKFILTIHDLIMIKHEGSSKSAASTLHPFIHALKYFAYRFVLRIACIRACAIITVSNSVKKDVVQLLAVPDERIHVIHQGGQLTEYRIDTKLPLAVRKPYCINVGNAYPHKNIPYLLGVFEHLKKEGNTMQLVLCGQEDYFRDRILAEIKKRELEGVVVHLGYVPDAQLASLYQHAQAALFPSFEEGFGFGPLEAALLGVPVIASRIPVFAEIMAQAAVYVDPFDQYDMIYAIKKLDVDVLFRKNLIEKGRMLARVYSWEKNAKMTSNLYHI